MSTSVIGGGMLVAGRIDGDPVATLVVSRDPGGDLGRIVVLHPAIWIGDARTEVIRHRIDGARGRVFGRQHRALGIILMRDRCAEEG